jgi:hypothetical protein
VTFDPVHPGPPAGNDRPAPFSLAAAGYDGVEPRRRRHHHRHRHRRRSGQKNLLVLGGVMVAIVGIACAFWIKTARQDSRPISRPGVSAPGGPGQSRSVMTQAEVPALEAAASSGSCDYYASPNGTGNGLSTSSPFKVSNFWSVASAGKTLCLMDGTYRGNASMILPPKGLNGSPRAPITVEALRDGGVLIDGESSRRPVLLNYNDWFVIQGINACCSNATVVEIANSNHNVIRRVAAWDAVDSNRTIFGANSGNFNLFEDVAGWGTARKIYAMSQGGNYTTVRRAWGRWERSTVVGPKMTYSLAYNSYHMTCENCIGTWSGQGMPESYVLLDYFGKPWTGPGAGTYTNGDLDQPYGIFAIDREDGDKNADIRLLGSLAYVLSTDTYKAPQAVLITKLDSVRIENTAVYIEPGANVSVRPFGLYGLNGATNLQASGITSDLATPWVFSNVWENASLKAYSAGETIFNTARGANLQFRYQDGILTDVPLWPWPMNQRIKDAMVQSGREPVDVTATVESFFGPVPPMVRPPVKTPSSSRPSPGVVTRRPGPS